MDVLEKILSDRIKQPPAAVAVSSTTLEARGAVWVIQKPLYLPVAGGYVLDVGGGLGGPARMLAQEFNARVTVIDLTEAFISGADSSSLVGDYVETGSAS